jgi:DNA-binding IclR family transcriptional regulator
MSRARPTSRPPRPSAGQYYSKVVGRALATLDAVRAAPGPLSLNDLTLRVGLAKTSIFRILRTLEAAGYLERDPAGQYLAPAALRPSTPGDLQPRLVEAALPRLKALAREFGETVSLAMRFENHIEVVATIESPQLVRMGNTVGRILPPHASSLGKAITAFQPEDRRESLVRSYGLHRFTAHTITDEIELRQEWERVRAAGHSLDAEESALEGCCFGAPILGADGTALAAVSLSMPKMRLGPETAERVMAALRRAAGEIGDGLR